VHPRHQRRGLGRALVRDCLERFDHVRQKVLLTDDRPSQLAFYASLGFHNTRELEVTRLNAFVIIEGAQLS
jgi:ribosomal protein S18 acetylase RimI-like enzyme